MTDFSKDPGVLPHSDYWQTVQYIRRSSYAPELNETVVWTVHCGPAEVLTPSTVGL